MALIGPGAGSGVSGLLPTGAPGRWAALQGEGGHVTLAAGSAREAAVLQLLRREFGHASAERAVSGLGLVAMHTALCELDGLTAAPPRAAREISALALDGSNAQCVEALNPFCAFLGNVAGNLALTLGARGEVHIGGGIVPRLVAAFGHSRFSGVLRRQGVLSHLPRTDPRAGHPCQRLAGAGRGTCPLKTTGDPPDRGGLCSDDLPDTTRA